MCLLLQTHNLQFLHVGMLEPTAACHPIHDMHSTRTSRCIEVPCSMHATHTGLPYICASIESGCTLKRVIELQALQQRQIYFMARYEHTAGYLYGGGPRPPCWAPSHVSLLDWLAAVEVHLASLQTQIAQAAQLTHAGLGVTDGHLRRSCLPLVPRAPD